MVNKPLKKRKYSLSRWLDELNVIASYYEINDIIQVNLGDLGTPAHPVFKLKTVEGETNKFFLNNHSQ